MREKEDAQVAVLEEYASGVDTMGEEEMAEAAARVIGQMRTDGQTVNAGSVLKVIFGPGGELEGKPVEKAEVARIVKGML